VTNAPRRSRTATSPSRASPSRLRPACRSRRPTAAARRSRSSSRLPRTAGGTAKISASLIARLAKGKLDVRAVFAVPDVASGAAAHIAGYAAHCREGRPGAGQPAPVVRIETTAERPRSAGEGRNQRPEVDVYDLTRAAVTSP